MTNDNELGGVYCGCAHCSLKTYSGGVPQTNPNACINPNCWCKTSGLVPYYSIETPKQNPFITPGFQDCGDTLPNLQLSPTNCTPPFSLPYNCVEKPWGKFWDYYRSETTVVKRLLIRPGQRFSYQYHNHRDEFWSIESGTGLLTLNSQIFEVGPGFSVQIKKLDKHRLANVGEVDLIFFEIQSGKCSEEDIVRLSDDYART